MKGVFYRMKSNCLIAQSGGPTAVINNSLVGILDEMERQDFRGNIYGSVGGIQGILSEELIELSYLSMKEKERLRWTPGSALGTCRHKLTLEESEKIIRVFERSNIRYFFYIGGNGSMQVARMIEDAALTIGYDLTVIGIPKSIDNDLMETDHSPGYGSAAKFLTTSLLDMQMDVASYPNNNRVTVIEAMGRHTGWLAAACALAENDAQSQTMIYIPEIPFHLNECIKKVHEVHKENRNSFIVVAEGILNEKGGLLNEDIIDYDQLNRPRLGGVSTYLQQAIEDETGISTRSIAPSIWQRSSVLLSSKTDVDEAYEVGKMAWKYAKLDYSGIMIGMDRLGSTTSDYEITYAPKKLQDVAGREKFIPTNWYDQENHTMTSEFIHYVRPLIQGEISIPMTNGLPRYTKVI